MDMFSYIDHYTVLHLIAGLFISKILLSIFKITPARIILIVLLIALAWEVIDGYLTGYNGLQDSFVDVFVTVLIAIIVVI